MDTTTQDIALEIRRTYAATPTRVFEAWTKAEGLSAWFAPTAEMSTIVHELDVRIGGAYRIEMRHISGKQHIVRGTYTEVESPTRLSFTWSWEDKQEEESLVALEFRAVADGTEVVLRHTRFLSAESRAGHNQGWEACLARLAPALTT